METPSKIIFLLLGFLLTHPLALSADDGFEVIDSERVDWAVVIRVPEGVRRIRLRIRTGEGIWETRTLAHLKGEEGYLKLRLPDGVEEEDIEVAASWSDPFPYEFYAGKSEFEPLEGDGGQGRLAPGDAEFTDGATGDEQETVEESDIWKWRGDVLYFFNQYRGLQVVDASDPAAPRRLASMRIPASGEQLYLHPEEDFAVLLTHDSATGNGEVLLVEHTADDNLIRHAAVPLPGYILESRMVGSMLYVVSRQWWRESAVDPDTSVEHITWKSGLSVSKIDLSDPAGPVVRDPLDLQSDQYDYWGGQVQATSEALMIATSRYDSQLRQSISTVHVVDISDPAEEPELAFQVPVKGQVLNKFNMHFQDGILTVVSQVWRWQEDRRRYASVETFDLSQPSEGPLQPLGAIEFANNESITASRFAGDLLYVVTFLRIDPLFIISLADPANPQLLGELEVPGFSTHLEVLDDRLISVGVEDSRIAVSWFDVSNPAEPALTSRVYVGEEDGWSWSEANWDEKAFGFFPEEGWILLPYQGYDSGRGSTSGVQLIEMGDNELVKRGSIDHDFQARRARVAGNAVVSISGQSLKSLDIADPDNPLLLAELTLAWPADYVHRVGDYLIQLERGPIYGWGGAAETHGRLYVSPAEDPDELVARLELPSGRVAGTLLKDGCLIVALEQFLEAGEDEPNQSPLTRFSTVVIDVGDPANPQVTGSDSEDTASESWYGFGSDYLGVFLPDDVVLWYPSELNYYFFAEPGIGGFTDAFFPYYPSTGKIHTVSVADKSRPGILASASLLNSVDRENEGRNQWAEGGMKLVDSVLYYGLQSGEYVETPGDGSRWYTRHWLGQVDLGDPAAPRKTAPLEIPGTFESMLAAESGGLVLFTSRHRSYSSGGVWKTEHLIQASAFDGLSAFLLDTIDLGDRGYGPRLFEEEYLVIGYTDYSSGRTVTGLTTYEWLESGSFLQYQTLEQDGAIYRMDVVDDLLIAPGSGTITVIDFTDPADLERSVTTFPNRNFWQRVDLIDVYERELAYLPLGWYGVAELDFKGAFQNTESFFGLREKQAEAAETWMSINLATLSRTRADNPVLLDSLGDGEQWMFEDAVEKMGYGPWMRSTLELSPQGEIPAGDTDSDGDGFSNAWEYFTGTHPGDEGDGLPVSAWTVSGQDGRRHLYLGLPYNLHAEDALTTVPQFSYDLDAWADFPEGFEQYNEDFSLMRVFRMLEPAETLENLFLRLRVSDDSQ